MYCRNCGNEIDPNAAICTGCGFKKGEGDKYCANCNSPTNPGATVCTNCGYALEQKIEIDPDTQKSKMAAGLLGIFFGGIGVHNFYLGYKGKAIAQLLITLFTFWFGGFFVTGIWGLVEGIMILCGAINKDGKGIPLKD